MIVVKLQGGLGNQMFQYALGRASSLKHNVPLLLDLSFFKEQTERPNFTPRSYELDLFNLPASIAQRDLIDRFTKPSITNKLKKTIGLQHYKYYRESTFSYDSSALQIKPPVYFDGYWQTEEYFKCFRNELLQDFNFKPALDEKNNELLNVINQQNSVSIHVRRGDFIKSENNKNFHGVCSASYYYNSINTILKNNSDAKFYVFTDDANWVKQNIASKYEITLVSGNGGRDSWKDMLLMKSCKHNIIANSSFSWWAGWLNTNDKKIVLAPSKWFATSEVFWNYKDVLPASWIKINNG